MKLNIKTKFNKEFTYFVNISFMDGVILAIGIQNPQEGYVRNVEL